jgi:hypothetical protein
MALMRDLDHGGYAARVATGLLGLVMGFGGMSLLLGQILPSPAAAPGLAQPLPAAGLLNPGKDADYPNCDAAWAAGAAPIRRGDPGYGRHLDGDGDGVGCE